MAAIILHQTHTRPRKATSESPFSRWLIIGIAVAFMGLMFVLPLVVIFQEAFRKGWEGYVEAFDDRATTHAIWLTLQVAAITVPLNTLFGLAAAWCVSPRSGDLSCAMVRGGWALRWDRYWRNHRC